jgi:hypothetical protein
MNWGQIEGKWKQSMGKVKEAWGKLTDDDLTAVNGKKGAPCRQDSGTLWNREGRRGEAGR